MTRLRSGYGPMDRGLYWITLEPSLVRRLCFDLDAMQVARRVGDQAQWFDDRPVYVCGMARSGTTMLLRVLSCLPEMRSLSYSDMPFVLAPNLWQRFSHAHRREISIAERAHGDGILVDLDSPEAFEEVFWKTFGGVRVARDRIVAPAPDAEVMRRFAEYRRIVVASTQGAGPGRYLSKNNNNLLRIAALAADPQAAVVVAYRDPFSTARSSHHQHARFSMAQQADAFVRNYMRWLVHHEFGLDHRPLGVVDPGLLPQSGPGDLDYWLAYWIQVHRFLLESSKVPVVMLDHDRLREVPESVLSALFERLKVRADVKELAGSIKGKVTVAMDGFSSRLVEEATEMHQRLRADSRNLPSGST